VLYLYGVRQIIRWWLPGLLILLSVPLPAVVLGPWHCRFSSSPPSGGGAAGAPARAGAPGRNVIQLPGRSLFVTEACSGLRSLTALIALGVLVAGLWLRSPWSRVLLVLLAIPVAMILNAVRVFLTGFCPTSWTHAWLRASCTCRRAG